jgi:hypothetical protein
LGLSLIEAAVVGMPPYGHGNRENGRFTTPEGANGHQIGKKREKKT